MTWLLKLVFLKLLFCWTPEYISDDDLRAVVREVDTNEA